MDVATSSCGTTIASWEPYFAVGAAIATQGKGHSSKPPVVPGESSKQEARSNEGCIMAVVAEGLNLFEVSTRSNFYSGRDWV